MQSCPELYAFNQKNCSSVSCLLYTSSGPLTISDEGTEGGRDGEVKEMDGSCLTTKELGCTGLFSPSGLSAAPESNIHLAWCIPGLETLMWFVGDSRWQVHGSTLLTDSADASGRVNNNTECLSPPSFLLVSNHTSYPPTLPSHLHRCTNTQIFFLSTCWCQETAKGTIRVADIQLRTIVLAISCFPLSSSHNASVPLLSMPLSLYP